MTQRAMQGPSMLAVMTMGKGCIRVGRFGAPRPDRFRPLLVQAEKPA